MWKFIQNLFGGSARNPEQGPLAVDHSDIRQSGFPLVPDSYHLKHVGKTANKNGYWITPQLVSDGKDTRDFVAAYVFDPAGDLISCDIVDLGCRSERSKVSTKEIVRKLKKKIGVATVEEIRVKPFETSFYGQVFGLVVRKADDQSGEEFVVDAMPGWTLMFHGPWTQCNYAT